MVLHLLGALQRWRHQRLDASVEASWSRSFTGLCGSGVKSLRRGSAGRPTGGTCTTSLTSSTPALARANYVDVTDVEFKHRCAPRRTSCRQVRPVGAVLACPGRGAPLRWRSAAMKSLASARWSCCAGVRAPPALHRAPFGRARVDRQPPQCRGGAEMRSTRGARRWVTPRRTALACLSTQSKVADSVVSSTKMVPSHGFRRR
jgi:hypothetical protein